MVTFAPFCGYDFLLKRRSEMGLLFPPFFKCRSLRLLFPPFLFSLSFVLLSHQYANTSNYVTCAVLVLVGLSRYKNNSEFLEKGLFVTRYGMRLLFVISRSYAVRNRTVIKNVKTAEDS